MKEYKFINRYSLFSNYETESNTSSFITCILLKMSATDFSTFMVSRCHKKFTPIPAYHSATLMYDHFSCEWFYIYWANGQPIFFCV